MNKSYSFKDGYIFYNRLKYSSASNNWSEVYNRAIDDLATAESKLDKVTRNDVSKKLKQAALYEQIKERRLLKEMFGIDSKKIELSDYPKFINDINRIMGLKEDYQYLLKLLDKNKGKERAPAAASFFTSALTTVLTEKIRNFTQTKKCEDIIMKGNEKEWNSKMLEIYDESVEKAIKKLSNQKDVVNGKEVQIWTKIRKLLEETNKLQLRQFKEDMLGRLNIDKMIRDIYKWEIDRRNSLKKTTRGLSTKIKSNIAPNELGVRSVNGFINEYFTSAVQDAVMNYNKGGALKSNMLKTDVIELYSLNTDFNLEQVFNTYNETIAGSTMEENRETIKILYDKYIKNVDNSFIIYQNAKLYSLGDSFKKGFSSGNNIPLANLPTYLDEVGLNINGEDLVKLLYNTIPGTILNKNNKSVRIKQTARLFISAAIANFLFDDWETIGESSSNAIHMFNLDNVLVPLSYLLLAIAEVLKRVRDSSSQLVRISFNLPKQIEYPIPIKLEEGEDIRDYWNRQRNIGLTQSSFSINFLSNFKSLIKSLIKSL